MSKGWFGPGFCMDIRLLKFGEVSVHLSACLLHSIYPSYLHTGSAKRASFVTLKWPLTAPEFHHIPSSLPAYFTPHHLCLSVCLASLDSTETGNAQKFVICGIFGHSSATIPLSSWG
ncbi:hypothetical protein NE237_021380 [Protea cynaroides]|uniref:Uncharacterized protein n=1 Tax=Protea cynaroides TaxID=273540 RepID=A0A9Q0H8Z9_9MAGN|nr:hypothetical protein NE237_021380 [Protea cynaroides]